jgi:hypothetical protein
LLTDNKNRSSVSLAPLYRAFTLENRPLANSLDMEAKSVYTIRAVGLFIGAGGVIFLFLLRDVFILGSKQELAFRKLALYAILISMYLLAAMRISHSMAEGRAPALLHSPWFWAVTLGMHAGLWWAAARSKRRPHGGDWIWWIALVPAPMFVLSITAISHRLSGILDGWNTLTVAVVVWAAWMMLVLTGVLVFRTVYREWEDWDLVADVAAIASWTGIGVVSFTGVAQWLQIILTYD